MTKVLVTGAGGFIGHHLVKRLKKEGCWVRGADLRRPQFEDSPADKFFIGDLRRFEDCEVAMFGVEHVYHLAADMGGIGYISENRADLARNSALINLNMLQAARKEKIGRYFFSSSACVYPAWRQEHAAVAKLKEKDAWPADPEPGYGMEKLFAEELCKYFAKDYGMEVRIARFHNIYGPLGTYSGGKEKAPAALCRKVAQSSWGDDLVLWGDGKQTRSFCFIDDCIEGILRIMASDCAEPINLGSEELVSMDELLHLIVDISGKTVPYKHDKSKPQGVRGRNSDNTKLRSVTGWEPKTSLKDGLKPTYEWIAQQVCT